MPSKSNIIKDTLLGMKFGTAYNVLKKALLFDMARRLQLDTCFRCRMQIVSVDEFSIEHKEAWQKAVDPIAAFFDLDNISFSHHRCNIGAATYDRIKTHGIGRYRAGCRCDVCKEAKRLSRGSAKSGD